MTRRFVFEIEAKRPAAVESLRGLLRFLRDAATQALDDLPDPPPRADRERESSRPEAA